MRLPRILNVAAAGLGAALLALLPTAAASATTNLMPTSGTITVNTDGGWTSAISSSTWVPGVNATADVTPTFSSLPDINTYTAAQTVDESTSSNCSSPGAWVSTAPINWIWPTPSGSSYCPANGAPDPQNVKLSTSFDVPGTVSAATISIAADNWAFVEINGQPISQYPVTYSGSNYESGYLYIETVDVSSYLLEGVNTIQIFAVNSYGSYATQTSCYYGHCTDPAGVSASLSITYSASGASCKDGGWQTYTDAAGNAFTNQGDCVSYLVSHGYDPSNG